MESPLYRLNDDKLNLWLHCKMEALMKELKTSSFNSLISTDARASTFISSSKKTSKDIGEDTLAKISIGLLSEYLDQSLLSPILDYYLYITHNIYFLIKIQAQKH